MKCTLIGCNENMSLPRLSLFVHPSLFAQRKKLSDNQTKLKIKSRETDKTTANSTAAIIITITRVRHRMQANAKLVCAACTLLCSPLRFARLSFHFFSFCLCQPFSLYFVLTLCDSIRFYWFSALGGLELYVASLSSCKSSEGCVCGAMGGERCRSMNNERQCKRLQCEYECESERQQQSAREPDSLRTSCERTTKQQIKQSIKVHKASKQEEEARATHRRDDRSERQIERAREKKRQRVENLSFFLYFVFCWRGSQKRSKAQESSIIQKTGNARTYRNRYSTHIHTSKHTYNCMYIHCMYLQQIQLI